MSKDDDDEPDLFGTNPHFLHRREGPSTSVAAAYAVDSKSWERRVLAVISVFDTAGCISDEVKAAFPKGSPYPSITARYSALDTKGYIRRNPIDTRQGLSRSQQQVMRITPLGREALRGVYPVKKRKK